MNLLQIKQKINSRLDENVGDDRLNDFINSVYQRVIQDSRAQWKFLQGSSRFVTVPGQSEYSIASNISANVDRIYNIKNSSGILRQISPREADATELGYDATGLPLYYHEWGGNIVLYPEPTIADNHEVRFIRKVNELINDTDVPLIPTEFQEILIVGAMMLFYEYDEDPERFDRKTAEFNRLLTDMIAKNGTDVNRTYRIKLAKNFRVFSDWDYQ